MGVDQEEVLLLEPPGSAQPLMPGGSMKRRHLAEGVQAVPAVVGPVVGSPVEVEKSKVGAQAVVPAELTAGGEEVHCEALVAEEGGFASAVAPVGQVAQAE